LRLVASFLMVCTGKMVKELIGWVHR